MSDNHTTPWEAQFVRDLRRFVVPESYDDKPPKNKQIAHEVSELVSEAGTLTPIADTDEIWVYDSETGLWTNKGEQRIRMLVNDAVGSLMTPGLMRNIRLKLQALPPTDRDDLVVPDGTVPVENGLLDMKSRELQPLSPEAKATWKLPVVYDPDADCPRFKQFIDEIFIEKNRPSIQEYLGYSFTPSTRHEKALLLLGPTNTGKSVFLDVVRSLFGRGNTASVAPEEITNTRWGTADLRDKQVNVRHDLDAEKLERPGKLKEVISGNPVRAEQKYQPSFSFTPRVKHFFAGNDAPQCTDSSDAFWNRWITVITPVSVPEDERDLELVDKLTTPEELSGILNYALEGYERLRDQGRFTNAPTPTENRHLWFSYGSSVTRFLASSVDITKDHRDYEFVDELYARYETYVEEHDLPKYSKEQFGREMNKQPDIRGGRRSRKHKKSKGRVYLGVEYTG